MNTVPITVEDNNINVSVADNDAINVQVNREVHDFTGTYIYTPTESTQTIPIADKRATQDIILNPIPDGYVYVDGDIDISANGTYDVSTKEHAIVNIPWTYMGEEPYMMMSYSYNYTLADTTYADWTPSTTAKSIKSGVNTSYLSADFEHYEYVMRWQTQFVAAYKDGATLKIIPYKQVAELWQVLNRKPSSLTNIIASNNNNNVCTTYFTAAICAYYNSSGNLASGYTASYGIYPGATAPTFGSTTDLSTSVAIKTPSINARCSTTYMSTTRANDIATTSTFKIRGWLYRIKKQGFVKQTYDNVISLYNNPIT